MTQEEMQTPEIMRREEIQRPEMMTQEEMQTPEIMRRENIQKLLTVQKGKGVVQFQNRLAGPRLEPQPATIQTQLNHSMLIHEHCNIYRASQEPLSVATHALVFVQCYSTAHYPVLLTRLVLGSTALKSRLTVCTVSRQFLSQYWMHSDTSSSQRDANLSPHNIRGYTLSCARLALKAI
jgi:hypothetical protein